MRESPWGGGGGDTCGTVGRLVYRHIGKRKRGAQAQGGQGDFILQHSSSREQNRTNRTE